MSEIAGPLKEADESPLSFIQKFMVLAVVSGGSIALGRIATQLFAIHLGATPLQIGLIMALEQAAMVMMALPAGFLISKLGVRASYFTASLGPMLVYAVMPFAMTWQWLAVARGLIGICIPFRIVSMNTSFLRELPRIGPDKAGLVSRLADDRHLAGGPCPCRLGHQPFRLRRGVRGLGPDVRRHGRGLPDLLPDTRQPVPTSPRPVCAARSSACSTAQHLRKLPDRATASAPPPRCSGPSS